MGRGFALAASGAFALAGAMGSGPGGTQSGYDIVSIAMVGQPGPEPDSTYAAFDPNTLAVSSSGDVIFVARIRYADLSVSERLWRYSGGTTEAVSLAWPGYATASPSGRVLVMEEPIPGSLQPGLVLYDGGVRTTVVAAGDPAPEAGGSFEFLYPAIIGDQGPIAFSASVAGGSSTDGVFVESGATYRAVALRGRPAPGTQGSYDDVGDAAQANDGTLAYVSSIVGDSAATKAIFVDSGDGPAPRVRIGDPAPGTSETFTWINAPVVTDGAEVAFYATTGAHLGYFLSTDDEIRAIALSGDAAPGAPGRAFG